MSRPWLPPMPWSARGGDDLPFIPASKNVLGEWLVTRLVVEPALRRAFGGVYLHVDRATLRLRGRPPFPVIFCATHSGWWDGHTAYIINKKVLRHDGYLMMEEVNLRRYPFFTWGGVFGIDRHDARKAIASIEYVTRLLKEGEGNALWMFPQGTMRHPDARPLRVYGGAAHIARRLGRCALVPVAIRYDFLLDQAPYAFARIGPPIQVGLEQVRTRDLTAQLAAAMTEAADRLRADVLDYNTQPYRRILAGRRSINELWDGLLRLVKRGR